MKFIRNLFVFIIAVLLCAVYVNAKTDFFYNISTYIPKLEEYPLVTRVISDVSAATADVTSSIPSFSEIVAMIKQEEMPIDPEDVASNAYISDSPMLSFYPHENISVMVDETGTLVSVFGMVSDANKRHLIVNFADADNEELDRTSINVDTSGQFNKKISIPDSFCDKISLTVFAGPKEYGQFTSWVLNIVQLVRNENGVWSIGVSPVYENNRAMYERDKSVSDALKNTPSIQSDNPSIKSIAMQLTADKESGYDKAAALHDWVCSYVYYDVDGISSEETIPYYATDVVKNRQAVCLGFATLYAALCRSIELPCNVVSGYALGVGEDTEWSGDNIYTDYQNHAWNEVYVDGRWVIVDTTWDSQNRIENGEYINGDLVSHLYFDSNLQYFSQNHKILEYSKRR